MGSISTLSFADYSSGDGITFSFERSFASSPGTYTEIGGSTPFALEAGEVVRLDEAATNVTFLGTVTFEGRVFLHFRGPLGGTYLESFENLSIAAFFPTSFSTTGPEYSTANFVFCFLEGTLIRTPFGDVPIERLAIGDTILTAAGGTTNVDWIGRQTLAPRFATPRMMPVRIAAGALGHGLPETDLHVSTDHGMILDGLVVDAGALVNGTTITRLSPADLPERVTYYHIETPVHDVILANGAAAETFIDYAGRKGFDNYAEYLALFGTDRTMREMPRPRISAARHLPESLRHRLGLPCAAA